MYTPTWKQYEDKMGGKGEEALKATEAFIEERQKETSKSKVARDWEADRKKEAQEYKPTWVKNRIKSEKEEENKFLKELKQGGEFKTNIHPTGGFILIEIIRESKTSTGLYLPNTEIEPNTAWVVEAGEPQMKVNVSNQLDKIPSPVKQGQKILFKKLAGLELTIQNKECRLIQFSDVLATIDE